MDQTPRPRGGLQSPAHRLTVCTQARSASGSPAPEGRTGELRLLSGPGLRGLLPAQGLRLADPLPVSLHTSRLALTHSRPLDITFQRGLLT